MAKRSLEKDNNHEKWTEPFSSPTDNPVLRDIKAGLLKPNLTKPENSEEKS